MSPRHEDSPTFPAVAPIPEHIRGYNQDDSSILFDRSYPPRVISLDLDLKNAYEVRWKLHTGCEVHKAQVTPTCEIGDGVVKRCSACC